MSLRWALISIVSLICLLLPQSIPVGGGATPWTVLRSITDHTETNVCAFYKGVVLEPCLHWVDAPTGWRSRLLNVYGSTFDSFGQIWQNSPTFYLRDHVCLDVSFFTVLVDIQMYSLVASYPSDEWAVVGVLWIVQLVSWSDFFFYLQCHRALFLYFHHFLFFFCLFFCSGRLLLTCCFPFLIVFFFNPCSPTELCSYYWYSRVWASVPMSTAATDQFVFSLLWISVLGPGVFLSPMLKCWSWELNHRPDCAWWLIIKRKNII